MKAAVYYPWVYLKGGAERVLLELTGRSRHDWTIYTNRFERESTFPELRDVPMRCLREIPVRRTVVGVAQAGMTLLTQKLDLRDQEALIVISEGLGNLVTAHSRVPTSCVCLTPLKIAYDPVTRERYFANRWRPHYRAAIALYTLLERPFWRRYKRVFSNSEEVRRRLLANRLVPANRIEVLHHGVDSDWFKPTNEREPYFLVAGRVMWSKNIELAIAAWKRFKPDAADNAYRLVIAGAVDMKSRSYLASLQTLTAERGDVDFVVSPSDDDLRGLYQRSRAVIFTAPNEDWGLVPLEAMACGKAVLAPDRGGPTESIVDGKTGFLRPDTVASFAATIAEIAAMHTDSLDRFAVEARARARCFSWASFIRRIDEHIDELSARELAGATS
jgi:glycosyltransferase involved in cell wall biosynthesis